jgi:hypothetical protein
MIKPLTVDLAQPLYLELPTEESRAADIESDFESGSASEAYWRLENSLQRTLGDEHPTLYVRG